MNSALNWRQRTAHTFLSLGAATLLLSGLSFTAAAQAPAGMNEQMLDVGGRKLHAIRMGQGEATVVFESGFSMDLSAWRRAPRS